MNQKTDQDPTIPWDQDDWAGELLPQPWRLRRREGTFRLADGMCLHASSQMEEPETAALGEFHTLCSEHLVLRLEMPDAVPDQSQPGIYIRLAQEGDAPPVNPPDAASPECIAQGYRLTIKPRRVDLVGQSSVGVFHGLQTLRQMLVIHGRSWPCLEVEDVPDFAVRGLSYDVSRGKVPTMDTLKRLVDRLAGLKVNHLQLYIEHTFAFEFNPNIGRDCAPLTPAEIRELDAYCRLRRIDLVPSLASCGHMGFVLSLPEYRHLAEVETTKGWWDMRWGERMRGLTLDVTNPESLQLLENMYDELLPPFSSGMINVCCDETYDLGQGKNKARAEEVGIGTLYLEHIRRLREICRKHGKRLMFWGDIIKKYPELVSDLPDDAVVLHWDYLEDADYESTRLFCEAGLTTYVCPGTSAWNRVLNDIDTADINIRRHAAAGRKYGATGLLNTDWGDEGHFNLLGTSWHPLTLGAAMGWNSSAPSPEQFDRTFGRLFWGDQGGDLVNALRQVNGISNLPRSWPTFCEPLSEVVPRDQLDDQTLARWREVSTATAERFSKHTPPDEHAAQDLRELTLACRANALVADRIGLSRRLAADHPDDALPADLLAFADACEKMAADYQGVWLSANTPSCLREILAVFSRLADEAGSATGR